MNITNPVAIYDLSINARSTWQAHSLSNAGDNGSNRLLSRRQLLADGTETDACSGNILKHYHAMLTAEYMEATGIPLCPACASRDGRRVAALIGLPEYKDLSIERIVRECGLCDAHGFLITAKNAASDGSTEARERISKHSLVEFGFSLALPDSHAETMHLMTRVGDSKEGGQMLLKMPARSGTYAFVARYNASAIGVDTYKRRLLLPDGQQRQQRHIAILAAFRDLMVSPSGALTSTMLPHLTDLVGAIVIRHSVGRAPMCSPLKGDFVHRLIQMSDSTCQVLPFDGVDAFYRVMGQLIETSYPYLPTIRPTPPLDSREIRT
jgi:CRISPR-associated protein Cst2